MNTLNKILAWILAFGLIANSYAATTELNVESVNSSDKDNLIITLDNEIDTMWEKIDWDVSIFKDLEVLTADITSSNIVSIELAKPLKENTSYSIMSFRWVSWDMNFDIKDKIEGVSIENNSFDLDLEKITLKDKYNIDIVYAKDIEASEVVIKLLKEINIESLTIDLDSKKDITAKLWDSLDSLSKYILMIYAIENEAWQEYSFVNPIFEFTSSSYETEESQDNTEEIILDEEVTTDDVIKNIEETLEEDVDPMMTWKIEEVALNSAETPDTWAETNVLIVLTFIVTSVVFLRRKFVK